MSSHGHSKVAEMAPDVAAHASDVAAEAAAHVAEHGGHGHHAYYEDPTFWVAMSFILVVMGLAKPVSRGLKALFGVRAEKIKSRLEDARTLREDTQAMLAEFEKKQRNMADEIEAISVDSQREAEHVRTEFMTDLNDTMARREEQAKDRLALAERQATEEVRDKSIELSLAATTLILKDSIKATDANKMIDGAIDRLSGELASL